MKQKTSALDYYNAVMQKEGQVEKAGTLFYVAQKPGTKDEYVLESVIVDFGKKDLCLKILERTMKHPDFIAFPGTPEFYEFIKTIEL